MTQKGVPAAKPFRAHALILDFGVLGRIVPTRVVGAGEDERTEIANVTAVGELRGRNGLS